MNTPNALGLDLAVVEHIGGHKFARDRDGQIDDFVWEEGFHNGPRCEICGWEPCVWCLNKFGGEIRRCVAPTADGGGI